METHRDPIAKMLAEAPPRMSVDKWLQQPRVKLTLEFLSLFRQLSPARQDVVLAELRRRVAAAQRA